MLRQQGIGRRGFLKAAAVPMVVEAGSVRAGAAPAPSDRVVVGLIGVGVRGRDHHQRKLLANPRAEIAAVCDVDRNHADRSAQIILSQSRKRVGIYYDFRALLERRDIDAVVISTPDHWHSIQAIQAMEAGKDVYCEKPLTLSIAEGRRMVKVARQYGAVFQVGSQQRSDPRFRQAVALVRNGRLGRLLKVTTHLGMPGTDQGAFVHPGVWEPVQTPPERLDWDLWLGPAPYKDYSPNRCHFEFRYHLDHSGGRMTDWGAHHNDIAQWALGADDSCPVKVDGKGVFNKGGPYNSAGFMEVRYWYRNGVELVCQNEGGNGVRLYGAHGWIFVSRLRLDASDPEILKAEALPIDMREYDERNRREEIPGTDEHHNDWLECIKTRKRCVADIESGHRSATVCHLGNISMRLGRPLEWDPAKEEFIGDPVADILARKPFRAPWRL